MFGVDYIKAQELGFKFIARDPVGGECVHREKPKKNDGGYWVSEGWRYVDGYCCLDKKNVMDIDDAIKIEKSSPFKAVPKWEPETVELKCQYCGKKFIGRSKNRKYCSGKCANDNKIQKRKAKEAAQHD